MLSDGKELQSISLHHANFYLYIPSKVDSHQTKNQGFFEWLSIFIKCCPMEKKILFTSCHFLFMISRIELQSISIHLSIFIN